jgi:phosphoglycolate phosphatase-like HAD superfamily hydrolase
VTRLLILFDVDGTLFLTDDPLAGRALSDTLNERFGVDLPPDAIEHVDHEGQTALRIARLVLQRAGLEDAEIDRGLDAWCARFAERYVEVLAHADTSGWRAAPDADSALEGLSEAGHRLVLLTGNPEPMARARMERLGLARFFAPGEGAFGCDAESRVDLVGIARARSGGWPLEATIEVGDTQRDASSAHEAGIGSLLVDGSGLTAVAETLLAGEG